MNYPYFVMLFVGSSVVNIREADVLRAGVDAADVGVTVCIYIPEPIKVFSEENIRLNKDAASFVENVEHDESAPYGFEVVFKVTLWLLPHSLVQLVERFFYFKDGLLGKMRFEVACVDYLKLKQ